MRYYKGMIKCELIELLGKKAIIQYLEGGLVGNKKCGFKPVSQGMRDITLIRLVWKNKKECKQDVVE